MSSLLADKRVLAVGVASAAAYLYSQFCSPKEEMKPQEHTHIELPLPLRDTKNNPPLSIQMLTNKQTLKDVDFDGKRVLMRVDYNVKIKNGEVFGDRSRIETTLDSIRYILAAQGPKGGVKCITLMAHLGRPAGNYCPDKYSLEPVAKLLQTYFPSNPVRFLPECVGPAVEEAINSCAPGTIFLLENLRFHMEETGLKVLETDGKLEKIRATFDQKVAFRQGLSRLCDVFVFEGFGAAHRGHSSVIGIDAPQRVSGLWMEKEMFYYSQVLGSPKRPFLALLGGSKVSDKILVIENLLDVVDEMVIAGGMAYTFKKIVEGVSIGDSLFDTEGAKIVDKIMKKAAERGVKLHFPVDHIIADRPAADANFGICDDRQGIQPGWMALDIGPQSRSNFTEAMQRAETIFWNGPVGMYEKGPFSAGTVALMYEMVKATQRGATTVIGGGDTGAASRRIFVGTKPCGDQVSWVSTGGGSSLVLMEGKLLPAVGALSNKGDYSRPPPPNEADEVEEDDE